MLRTANLIKKDNSIKHRSIKKDNSIKHSSKHRSYLENTLLLKSIRSSFLTNLKHNGNLRKGKAVFFPNNGKISFELLNVFYTLILCGNMALASERLAISQPAISLSINKLEITTGSLLFQQLNSKKLIKLTPSGLILFNYIQRLFQIIQESRDISNLNYFTRSEQSLLIQKFHKNAQKNFNLLPALNRSKKISYSKSNLLTFNLFCCSLNNLRSLRYKNIKYFETSSKILLLKTRYNWSNKLDLSFSFSYVKISCIKLELDKLIPINFLSSNFLICLQDNNLIEVQTVKAFNLCLKLEISNLMYWGAEL